MPWRAYRQLITFILVLLLLVACSSDSVPETDSTFGEADTLVTDILVSSSLDRASATVLDGSLITGKAYIFMADTRGLAQLTLYIDKDEGSAYQEPYSSTRYDGLETSVAADYIDTSIFEDGIHVLTALIEKDDGSKKQVEASFLVDNNGELADRLLVSTSSSRRGAVLLGSSKVSGNSYIFVVPRDKTQQVSFFLNDPNRNNRPKQVERIIQYDFAGTADNGTAKPFDTRRQRNGNHTITAEIKSNAGPTKVISQSFTIDNNSVAPSPQEPTPQPSNLPIVLFGQAPEQKSLSLSVSKPDGASTATITLGTYDADRYGEGSLYINGNGPLRLFDKQASSNHHNKSTKLTYRVPGSWWRNGRNDLRFKHNYGEGFRIESINVSFSGSGGSNPPAPSPTSPPPAPSPSPTPSPAPEPTNPGPSQGNLQLRGNPNFRVSSMSAEEQKWYAWLWQAIDNARPIPDATSLAKSGDIFTYRGMLQAYIHSLLSAFRVTGDLRLLDEVDRLGQLMRSKLSDTNGDGYLNWVDKFSSDRFRGTDKQMAFDLKAHALVAEIAWALHNNRDLRSPSGANYGSHADFWKSYLVNQFEAKWRKRNGVRSGFPFAEHSTFHTYHSFMKWHHYMGRLTGNSAYTREAQRMSNVLWTKEFKEVSSRYGTAYVWARGVISEGSSARYLMPQDYARFVVQEAIDLHFEGFGPYKSNTTMKKFANSLTGFVIDDSNYKSFARDIGGGSSRGGLAASPTSWRRMGQARFAESSWAMLSAWDSSGKAAEAARKVFNDIEYMRYNPPPRRVFIPAAMFVKERLK